MSWGVRKPFAQCEALPHVAASFSFYSTDGGVVELDQSHCPEGGTVIGFEELEDGSLPRLQSVMDAEMRQNELRERFAQDPSFSFATVRKNIGRETNWKVSDVTTPYVLVLCGPVASPRGKELHIRSKVRPSRKKRHQTKVTQSKAHAGGSQHLNVIHLMFDSTSIHAFRRSATRTLKWLEDMNQRTEGGTSRVFTQKHYHSVSCCSPGNQVPMYAGVVNGEGDRFVASEPRRDSTNWLWNIADAQNFTTFWSLDNCPDKSARDYHATPSTDVRVVAPLCLAGVLLSHKDLECLGGRTVDEHVYQGLRSFWHQHKDERKFAALQFITPHEETEKQILELDISTAAFFEGLDASGEWNRTALVFWSDHGINFGKYATTHDGEFEKLLPFVHVMLPRWLADDAKPHWGDTLRGNQDKLVSPYDLYEVSRALLYYPNTPPLFASSRDKRDPPLPRPSESHIMASFQKDVTPINLLDRTVPDNRDCLDANIPVEFCTCIVWRGIHQGGSDSMWWERGNKLLTSVVLPQHRKQIAAVDTASGVRHDLCEPLSEVLVTSIELQEWPLSYKPKEQQNSKRVWMMPNRDMLKVRYQHRTTKAEFEATISIDKEQPDAVYDIATIDRLDAMKKKCGVVNKAAEHLCECR
ncbi:Hypothetical protein, putative [Bodo saltans]|uniref:Uncharacterized protein n=1 Tax=Bodo saltans TaxID=75058 RepID=A0A0S4JAV1_BODSA|nr:Hypothetical protein, putative [Bodo saltans]|eukprot:CUG86276.1 Hypothetical protein, putative [Bodo saltans]